MLQRHLGHHLCDLFQRAGAARKGDKGVAQLDHPGLPLGHVLRDDELCQAVVLHLRVDEELRLYPGHFAARRQDAVGEAAHQAAAGATLAQSVPALADPPAQLLDGLLQGRVIALVRPQIDCDIHSLFSPHLAHVIS